MVRSDHPARATRASTVHRGQYRTVLFEWIDCNSPAVLIRTQKWIVNTCSMIPQRKFQPFKKVRSVPSVQIMITVVQK